MTAVVRPLIALGIEDGQTGFAVWTSIFFVTYILLVNVVLLNVAVAVLLEGFLSSMADSEMEVKAMMGIQEYAKIAGSMDALISTFSSFDSTDQLHEMINRLFKYLDVDDSNSVSFLEFKDGLETLDMRPKLHVTEEDWKHFTGHGKFLDENEALDDIRFDLCMQEELKAYSQRIISHQMRQAMNYCKENSLDYLAHKMQMAEVFKISNRLSDLSRDWKEHRLSPSTATDVSGRETSSRNCGEREWKEVRDLLQQLAAEQKELRLGQQELRLGVKRLEDYVCEYGLAGRKPGENGVKTDVGSGVGRGAWSPATRAPEEIPALTSARTQWKSMEDLTGMSTENVQVGSTYASVRKDLIRDALTRRTGKSPGGGVVAPLPLPHPLPSSPLPLPPPLHCPSPSLSREHLDRALARLKETHWHKRLVSQNGAQTLVRRHNGSGSPGPKPGSESFANSTFDGSDCDGFPLP
jgi:hypothetical protein